MASKPAVKELAAASAGAVLPTVVQGFWKGARYIVDTAGKRAGDGPRGCNRRCCLPPLALLPRFKLDQLVGSSCCTAAEFDLEGLRSKLDEQGLAVATAQEASVRSRKALAERTKGGCTDGCMRGGNTLLWGTVCWAAQGPAPVC